MREYIAEAVGSPYFTVTGGPFTKSQHMGWHITTEDGFTVGIANDTRFCARLNDLEKLVAWLASIDAAYHLRELIDDGVIECRNLEEINVLLATYCQANDRQ